MTDNPINSNANREADDSANSTTDFASGTDPVFSDSNQELLDQLLDEFMQRLRAGKRPTIAEFQQRYPGLSTEIEALLSSVVMIEQLKLDPVAGHLPTDRLSRLGSIDNIDGYRIVRELGRGGMGVVFEAVHETLGRRVAIKVMPTPLVDGDQHVARFRQEARAAAKLHHTNVVGVFGVGQNEGSYYYVMDFVDGQALSDVIQGVASAGLSSSDTRRTNAGLAQEVTVNVAGAKTRPEGAAFRVRANQTTQQSTQLNSSSEFDLQQIVPPVNTRQYFHWAAQLGVSLADALDFAHAAKILHRDIKPSNMVLDKKGVIWITDFGLAKDAAIESSLTATGAVLGTPQYLAPEALEGNYDVRSETYCLGLTLYEIVALRPAVRPGTPAEVIRAIASQTPVSLRKINANIPIDLRTIIEKAIARDPGQRYSDARSLKNDLIAFVENRPISARRASSLETFVRWSRSNPMTAALAAVSAILLALVAVTATVGYLVATDALTQEAQKSERLNVQQQQTERARREAVENFDLMKRQFDRAEANVATTVRAFDQMFKRVIAPEANRSDIEIDGLREILGIESSVTADDAAFLEELVSFYQEFATNNADNEPLQAEAAKAFRRVGNIYHRVGQMQPAVDAYKKSLQLYEQVFLVNPESKQALLTITGVQYELGSASFKNGDAIEAHRWNKISIERLERSELFGTDPEIRLALARSLSAMGLNIFRIANVDSRNLRPMKLGDGGRRFETTGRSVDDNRQLAPPVGRGKQEGQRRWMRSREFMNSRGGKHGLDNRNRQLVARAIEIADALVAESPNDADYLSVQATCLVMAAAARIPRDRESGFELRNRAIATLELLVVDDVETAEYRYLLALACSLSDSPPRREDIKLIARSIGIVGDLLTTFPTNLDYHHLNAGLGIKRAQFEIQNGQLELGLSDLKAACVSLRVLQDLTPSDRTYRGLKRTANVTLQTMVEQFQQAGQDGSVAEATELLHELRGERRPPRFSRPR